MAIRIFCFCSSSRSLRSSIARVCCWNNSCSERALCATASSGRALGAGLGSIGAASRIEPARLLRLDLLRMLINLRRVLAIKGFGKVVPLAQSGDIDQTGNWHLTSVSHLAALADGAKMLVNAEQD